MNRGIILFFLCAVMISSAFAQEKGGEVHGSFQTDFQFYQPDEKLGITDSTLDGKPVGSNSYLNLIYTNGDFEAGVRFEGYYPPMLGFDQRYEGVGMANRYLKFKQEKIEVTAGNYYDQFGNGLVFRSYNDWNLGYDNSMDGIRVVYEPVRGVTLKGIAGVQRLYWDRWTPDDDRGIIKGVDANISVNDIYKPLTNSKTRIIIGGSFVSKYQDDQHPLYKMPENVAAYASRLSLVHGGFSFNTEYAHKINDPSADNGNIYKNGNAWVLNTAYARKGFVFNVGLKRIDNMSFRSDRAAGLADLQINYLPAISRQHVYTLAAMYPYATQPTGEFGINGTLSYKLKKKTTLGGRYGTTLSLNYTRVNSIEKHQIDENTGIGQPGTYGYESDFFAFGDDLYFEDINFEINRKINKNWKINLMYMYLRYNIEVIEGHVGEELVVGHIGIGEVTRRFKNRQALRLEVQHLATHEDEGDWVLGLLEYTKKGFFVTVTDQYNYGNKSKDHKIHYFSAATGFTKGTTRIAIAYGRQREGIICVGGVCRLVPASSGITLNISTSF